MLRHTNLFGLWCRIVGLRLPLGRRLLVVLEDFVDGGTAVGQLCVALQPGALPKQTRHFVRDVLLEVIEDGELRHGAVVVRHVGGRVLEAGLCRIRTLGEVDEVAQHVRVRIAALSQVE